MWVVMRIRKFEMETCSTPPLPVKVEKDKMIGFLAVYKTKEDALADFPSGPVMEIAKIEEEELCEQYRK